MLLALHLHAVAPGPSLWARSFLMSNSPSFMAPQKCSVRHFLPTEHCCFTWAKNKNRYKWLSKFHSWLNVFYLSARKVPYFCSYSMLFGGISSAMPLHQKLDFKDPGLQATEGPSNVNELQSWPAKGTLETTTSGWNVQYPLTKPLRPPVMLMDFFSCCLDINSAYWWRKT